MSEAMSGRPPPRRTGKPPEEVSLGGLLLPWHEGQPSLIELPGAGDSYLVAVALFSTLEKLESAMKAVAVPYQSVKKIDDSRSFLVSIPPQILVVVDPWITPEGTTRYTQLLRD